MERVLIEAGAGSGNLNRREIVSKFNDAYGVLQFIANQVTSNNSAAAGLAYMVSFVHPEVKHLTITPNKVARGGYTGTADSMLREYAVVVPPSGEGQVDEDRLMAHPMVRLLEDARAGFIMFAMDSNPRSANETESSSSFASEQAAQNADALRKTINENGNMTTESVLSRNSKAGGSGSEEISELVDYNTLFGFAREDLTPEAWEKLEVLERWYYAMVYINVGANDVNNEFLGKSVFSYVTALRNMILDPDVNKMLRDLDMKLSNPNLGNIPETHAGELKVDRDIFQLGALLGMFGNTSVRVPGDQKVTLFDFVRGTIDGFGDEAGVDKLAKFSRAPFGVTGADEEGNGGRPRVLKTPISNWKESAIKDTAQKVADSGNNPSAELLARQLGGKLRDSNALSVLKPLLSEEVKERRLSLVRVIALILSQYNPENPAENLETGLLEEPEGVDPLVGVTTAEEIAAKPKFKTPEQLAEVDPAIDRSDALLNRSQAPDTRDRLTGAEYEVSVLDPTQVDVKGSYVLPKISIPLFAVKVESPDADDPVERQLYRLTTALVTYISIAYGDSNIPPLPWLSRETEAGEDETYIVKIGIAEDADINAEEVNEIVNEYFRKIAGSSNPANAVMLRNEWVDAITNEDSWMSIGRAILDYLDARIQRGGTKLRKFADTLADIIRDTRYYVERYIFNIKSGSYDYELSGELEASKVLPISPVNTEANGRLRLTGGAEGTVTSDGKQLLRSTMGKVYAVTGSNGERSFRVRFAPGSGIIASDIPESRLNDWTPGSIIKISDSDTAHFQYAIWRGVNFVTIQTDEGSMNTFERPQDVIDASNAEADIAGGRTNPMDSTPSMRAAAGFLGTASQPALTAVKRAGDILWKMSDGTYNRVKDLLAFVNNGKVIRDNMFNDAIQFRNIKGKTPLKAATDIMDGVANSLYATKLDKNPDFVTDISSMLALRSVMEFCSSAQTPESKAARIRSALESYLQVYANPFEVGGMEGDTVTLANTGEEWSSEEYFSKYGIEDEYAECNERIAQLVGQEGAGDDLYTEGMEVLNRLYKLYCTAVKYDFSSEERRNSRGELNLEGKISSFRDVMVSPAAVKCLADRIEAIMPAVRLSPEVMSRSVVDVMMATQAAMDMIDENRSLRKVKDDYNDEVGEGSPTRIAASDDPEAAELVRPDVTGERDDHTGDYVMSSVNEQQLDEFDASGDISTFSDVTDCTMLGMILCDPSGMHSGQGNFNVASGISPTEFKKVALALDSAHDTLSRISDGVVGKNMAIREYINSKTYPLDMAIDAFYNFMASKKPFYQRNVLAEAKDVRLAFGKVAKRCKDLTVLPMLREMVDAFNRVLSGVNSQLETDRGNPEANPEYVAIRAARTIATAIANIILNIESYNKNEMLSDSPEGLEVYGQRAFGQYGYTEDTSPADKYASVAMGNAGANNGRSGKGAGVLSRAKTASTKEAYSKFKDSTLAGMSSSERYANTLATIYDELGMGDTRGFMGAIVPFNDLVEKSKTKHESSYRNIYSGEAVNDLGAVLLYELMTDERNGSAGYENLNAALDYVMGRGAEQDAAQQGTDQIPVAVPAYVVKGLLTNDGQLDYDTMTWVIFDQNGSAIVSSSTTEARFDDAGSPAFSSLEEIGKVINVPLENGDSAVDVARKMREAVVTRKLDSSSALRTLRRRDSDTNIKLYADTVQRFTNTMILASRTTVSDGALFVPLSVLYMCMDDSALNSAMHHVIDQAASILRGKQQETMSDELMRSVYGEEYGNLPEIPERMEAHSANIKVALGKALQNLRAHPDTPKATWLRNSISANREINGEEIPNSSLRDILGEKTAKECLEVLLHQIPMDQLVDIEDSALSELIIDFVDRMIAKNTVTDTGKPLAQISDALVDLASQKVDVAAAVGKISETLGAESNTVAVTLVRDYMKRLGASSLEIASRNSQGKLRNVANETVDAAVNRNGEFRTLYLEAYPTAKNRELQARKVMHGTVPILGTETINNANGLDKLYNKVADALSGKVSADEAAEALQSVQFKINGCTGSAAIAQFNKYIASLKSKLAVLMKTTHDGIVATMKASADNLTDAKREALRAKALANKCGSEWNDEDGAGTRRAYALKMLNEVMDGIDSLFGEGSKDSKRQFENSVDEFAEAHCYWNDSASFDELTSYERASAEGNAETVEDYVALRNEIASAFARCKKFYLKDVVPAAGVASAARGVAADNVPSREMLDELLKALATIPESPVKVAESDMFREGVDYYINGEPVDRNECMAIISDALDKYSETVEEGEGVPSDSDELLNEDFYRCIRMCASMNKDIPISTDGIVSLLLNTLRDRKAISISSRPGYVRFRHRFNRYRGNNFWYTFDIPVSIIRDITNDVVGSSELSGSVNDWKEFADEISRYTSAGNRKLDSRVENSVLRNQLWSLFRQIVDKGICARLNNMMKDMPADEFDTLNQGQTVELGDGIYVRRSNIAQGDISSALYNNTRDEVSLPVRLPGDTGRGANPEAEPEPEGEPGEPEDQED